MHKMMKPYNSKRCLHIIFFRNLKVYQVSEIERYGMCMYFMVLSWCLLLRCALARAHTYATLSSLSKMTLCWHTSNEFHEKKEEKKPLLNISARLPARRDSAINFDILSKKKRQIMKNCPFLSILFNFLYTINIHSAQVSLKNGTSLKCST